MQIGKKYFVIGDIAGNYLTFLELLKKAPKDVVVVAVGDLNDRGPRSKEVIEWFVKGNGLSVDSNHGHLMIDAIANPESKYNEKAYYPFGCWFQNGGLATAKSYLNREIKPTENIENILEELQTAVPKEHIDYLSNLPKWLEFEVPGHDNLIVTHAPINPSLSWDQVNDIGDSAYSRRCETSLLWNRGSPRRIQNKFQVHGHNSYKFPTWFWDGTGENTKYWGICVDTSRAKVLTGIVYPTMEIIQQDYID